MHGKVRKKGLTLRTIQALAQAARPGMWSHERGLCRGRQERISFFGLFAAFLTSSPTLRSSLKWRVQQFDARAATSIRRTARMPTIVERFAMRTRLNSQNFAPSGQSVSTNLPMTDASSAVSIGMTHEFMPLAKTIDQLT